MSNSKTVSRKNKMGGVLSPDSFEHALTVYPMEVKFLMHSPGRPKRFDKAALDRVKREIEEGGLIPPILVAPEGNGSNVYHVLAGWLRVKAAADLGYDEVPCIFLDTDGDGELRRGIATLLDREHEDWDREAAIAFLEQLLNHALIVSDEKWLEYLARVDAARKEFDKAAKAAKRKK